MRKSRYVIVFPVKDKYLLIHGLSGAVQLVTKESAQQFFDGEMTEELKPFFTHLTHEEELTKAKSLCEFLMKKAAQCTDSTLVVTYDCNLRCPYCYEIWVKHPETMKAVINEYKVDKAFEALEELNRECTGKKPLIITGGEPFMKKNKDIIKYILKKGKDLGYTFTMFTNGMELNHFLSDISSVPVEYVMITLDGPRHLHDKRRVLKKGKGTFDTITKNIEEARKIGLPLLIRTNTDAEILSCIDEMASFFKGKGWPTDPNIQFSLALQCEEHADPETIEPRIELYEKIMNLSKRPELDFFEAYPFKKLHSLFSEHPKFWPAFWHCNAVSKRYVFDPFGDIYSCRGLSGLKEQRIGVYVPELSFTEKLEKWRNRTVFSMEKCQDCEIALICGGGCGYASLLNENDLYIPLCASMKRVIIDYLEYLYEKKE